MQWHFPQQLSSRKECAKEEETKYQKHRLVNKFTKYHRIEGKCCRLWWRIIRQNKRFGKRSKVGEWSKAANFNSMNGWIAEHKRKEAIAASSELTQALVDHLNVGWILRNIAEPFAATPFILSFPSIAVSPRLTSIKNGWMPKPSNCILAPQISPNRHSSGWIWLKDSAVRSRYCATQFPLRLRVECIEMNWFIAGNWRCGKLGDQHRERHDWNQWNIEYGLQTDEGAFHVVISIGFNQLILLRKFENLFKKNNKQRYACVSLSCRSRSNVLISACCLLESNRDYLHSVCE